MELTPFPRPSEANPSLEELQRSVRSLRFALNVALLAMVLLSGSVSIYLFRQVSLLRRQVDTAGRTALQAARNYNENVLTQAVSFERQLLVFAQTNREFAARLVRFFPTPTNTPAATPGPEGATGVAAPQPR